MSDGKDVLKKKTLHAKDKAEEMKTKTSEKGEEVKAKALEVKKGALDAKNSAIMKTGEIKEGAQEKTSKLKANVSGKGEEMRESAEETRTQTENKINDFIASLKDRQEEIGKSLSEYSWLDKPLIDVIDTGNAFIIKADLPNIEKKDISIEITEDSIEITANFADADENTKFVKRERNYGEKNRSVNLPELIEPKKAKAKFKDSVLTVELPKVAEEKVKLDIS